MRFLRHYFSLIDVNLNVRIQQRKKNAKRFNVCTSFFLLALVFDKRFDYSLTSEPIPVSCSRYFRAVALLLLLFFHFFCSFTFSRKFNYNHNVSTFNTLSLYLWLRQSQSEEKNVNAFFLLIFNWKMSF